MSVQVSLDNNTQPFILGGRPLSNHQGVIEQDAGRGSTALAPYTVLAQKPSSRKYVPLSVVDPTIVVANMVCGANGANLAAWQAVTDGAFKISFDGVEISLTGLDFSVITALDEIVDTFNAVLLGRGVAIYDSKADVVSFITATPGLNGTVSYLTAGASGTDVSGAGFLNGLTGTGVITAGTGADGTDIPAGIYMGPSITGAAIVAGDVSDSPVLIGGTVLVDENQMVLENSLTLNDVVISKNATVRVVLENSGIVPKASVDTAEFQA